MLPAIEIEPTGPHRSSIIWLHGLGADGHDFAPIATELMLPDTLGTRFILPHAPKRPVSINGGFVMRAWYDIAYTDLGRTPDLEGISASLQELEALIENEKKKGIPAKKILVAGFSQGAVLAMEAISQLQSGIGGAIALSGYLAKPEQIPEAKGQQHLYMAHGTQDSIVPFALGIQAKTDLEAKGYIVTWNEWHMAHTVCAEEISAIRSWILETLVD